MERKKDSKDKKKKSVGLIVITGCDTGIGRSLVDVFSQRGYEIVQSYLVQNSFESEPNVYSQKMDSRKREEVEGFCEAVKELCKEGKRLDALIINAGVALGGPIENVPMSMFRECFEVNFFGAVEIIQALIPELISSKGKIIINGSMAGKIAMPFLSPYVSTKFALEGFCDSLRREMNPFGIKTVLLEPGAVATPIWNKAKNQDISFVDKKYLKSLYAFRENFIEGGNQGMDSTVAALKIAEIIRKKNPKARYVIAQNRFASNLMFHVPTFILDKAVARMFHMDYGGKRIKKLP